jgi:hypothetical protein
LLVVILTLSTPLLCAADNPPPPGPPPGGPPGPRDPLAEYTSMIEELSKKPDFKLTDDQKKKIQTARDEFKAKQDKWRTEHADELKQMQELSAALFGVNGAPPAQPAKPAQWVRFGKLRDDLDATAPRPDDTLKQIEAVFTDPQRDLVEAWQLEHAPPRGPFGSPLAVKVPDGIAMPSDGVPKQSGFYKLRFQGKVTVPDGSAPRRVAMAYVLYLPPGYEAQKDAKYPTIVFLHGAGECGTDGNGIFVHGPAMELLAQANAPLAKKFPFILVCPQCPPRGERWDQPVMLHAVLALLDELGGAGGKVRIDPDRVYVTGLSMGGKGTWLLAMEDPKRFAAIAPIAADTLNPQGAAKLKAVTACWAIDGAEDWGGGPENNKKMVDAINAAGGSAKVSIVPGEGHFVWVRFYSDPKFYDWFLTHRRKGN